LCYSGAVWSSAFFHIDVEGELSSGEDAKPRSGKAFAIGPDHVVTARHVVGSKAEWAGTTKTATNSQRTLRPHELRVYQPVKRSIKLYREEDFGDNHKGNVVLPAVSEDLDAVGILVPGFTT